MVSESLSELVLRFWSCGSELGEVDGRWEMKVSLLEAGLKKVWGEAKRLGQVQTKLL